MSQMSQSCRFCTWIWISLHQTEDKLQVFRLRWYVHIVVRTVIRNLPRNCSWLRNCFLLEPPLCSGNPDCTDPILASIPNIMPICSGYATSREVGDKTGYTNHYARTAEQDNWWPFLACWGRVKVVVTIHGLKVFTCREIWFPSTRLLLLAVCICPGTSMGVSHFAKRY